MPADGDELEAAGGGWAVPEPAREHASEPGPAASAAAEDGGARAGAYEDVGGVAGFLERPPRTNRFAAVALATGLCGMVLFAVGFGVAALVQIRRRNEKGRGMAVGGLVAAGAWGVLIVTVVLTVAMAGTGDSGGKGMGTFQLYPRAGQCFDFTGRTRSINTDIVECDLPHDGEMVLVFSLPAGPWPGDAEVSRLGTAGCQERIRERFRTRTPVEGGSVFALYPRRFSWRIGNREVNCAITADGGTKFGRPLAVLAAGVRAWEDVKPGDCFVQAVKRSSTVRLAACDAPHTGQVTHTFTVPGARWPGTRAIDAKASAGCTARWDGLFAKNPPPVRIERWYLTPSKESWALGERACVCYVTGKGGQSLSRSVVPG